MALTPLPTPPSRQSPGTFSEQADAFLGAMPSMVSEINGVLPDIETAAGNAAIAQAAADAAIATTNITQWISGTTYAQGNVVWSPADFQAYRRTIAGAGATDPSADTTNWTRAVQVPATASVQTYQSQGGI